MVEHDGQHHEPGDQIAAGHTAARILDVAERLVQTRGFNRFSYTDIARELDITGPAVHYHFRSKADLGVALIERYHDHFTGALAELERARIEPLDALARYVELYRDVLRRDRLCLCGMLAAEAETLPETMRSAIVRFFDDNVAWLARLLDAGRRAGALSFDAAAAEEATSFLSALEGAMLIARVRHDPDSFDVTSSRMLAALAASPRS